MKTFMKFFDSTIQWIGLAVLPPAWSTSSKCDPGDTNAYNSTSAPYVVVGLSDDYKLKGGAINTNSNLYKTINCVQAAAGRPTRPRSRPPRPSWSRTAGPTSPT